MDKERTNPIINKCLNTIQKMLSKSDFIQEAFVACEDELQNLFVFLDIINKIEFEDELLQIATQIAKHTTINSSIYSIIQKNLGIILQKSDKTIDNLFELFYYWCLNGYKFILAENEELLADVNQ